MVDPAGKLLGYRGADTDVTERKATDRQHGLRQVIQRVFLPVLSSPEGGLRPSPKSAQFSQCVQTVSGGS